MRVQARNFYATLARVVFGKFIEHLNKCAKHIKNPQISKFVVFVIRIILKRRAPLPTKDITIWSGLHAEGAVAQNFSKTADGGNVTVN